MSELIPVLLDTDIGSDIDDAVALAYLLRQTRCELLGITTVTGDVAKRCALADVICQAVGRTTIPIHAGASRILLHGPGQPEVPQYEALRGRPHRVDWPANTAVEFLRRTIRSRPGEITLLTVGPLTNVALLFALDPEIPSLLKQVVSMAGVYFGKESDREWNCLVDPVATGIVCGARLPRHVLIGLDVTTQCQMPAAAVREKFAPPPLDLVRQMAEVWFQQRRDITFHDPLAAAVIFQPELCGYEEGMVTVDPGPESERAGRTRFTPAGKGALHHVARTVDTGRFFTEYFGVF